MSDKNDESKPEVSKESEFHSKEKEATTGLSKKEESQLTRIEFKSQSYASFYNTTMEKDKSILTLSVAGIGFLITLLKLTETIQFYDMAFFSIAALAFLVAIYCVITIFGKNASFIIDLTNNVDVQVKQYQLDVLDKWLIRSFYLGIVMSLMLGISTSTSLFLSKDTEMTKEQSKPQTQKLQPALESYSKAVNFSDSFSGAAALQTQAAEQPTATQPVSSSASSVSGAAAMMPKDDAE